MRIVKNKAVRGDVVGKFVGQGGSTRTGPMEMKGLKLSGWCRVRERRSVRSWVNVRATARIQSVYDSGRFTWPRPSLGPDNAAWALTGAVAVAVPCKKSSTSHIASFVLLAMARSARRWSKAKAKAESPSAFTRATIKYVTLVFTPMTVLDLLLLP